MATERYTRCPHCATVFRLEPGQLQQAQGRLRCGHCQHVFDATGCVVACGPADARSVAVPEEGPRLDLESLLRVEDRGPSGHPTAPVLGDELLAFERALASFSVPAPVPAPPRTEVAEWVPEEDAMPLRPPRKLGLGWAWLLVLLLMGQAVWATRTQWGVHWPALGLWAQTACERVGCAWRPWHLPGVLALEHAHLTRTATGHRLQWDLHNQAAWPAAMPSLELTLVDGHEQVLLRRVMSPVELQGPRVMAPLAHWSGELHWQMPESALVSGYRLLVFYP